MSQQAPKTAFQTHVSKLVKCEEGCECTTKNVADLTEWKLRRLMKIALNAKTKNNVCMLIDDYIAGKVAIAWSNGQPVFHRQK